MPVDGQVLREALAGHYTLGDEIGAGGMAVVYRAHDERHDRDVAVKVLRPELAALLGTGRFLNEIRITSRLQHPNILPVIDSGEAGGVPYYVMPLVKGESLRGRMERERQLPLDDALRIAQEVGDALAYAHGEGIVHRDIKPENILLSGTHAIVADFGIARAIVAAGGERFTSAGIALGTPEYMSPEQGSGDQLVDARADEYSLACVVHEMLVGEAPFTGPSAQAVLARHARERPPSIAVVRPAVPESIVAAVERALSKVPADRFPTVQAMVHALTEPALVPRARRARRRRAAVAAALVALAGAGAWLALRPPAPPLSPDTVVVFPLREVGFAPGDSGAGYDVALMLTAALEHTEPMRGLDGALRLEGGRGPMPARLLAAARALRARYYVDGVVRRGPDSMVVVLRLNDADGDSLVAQETAGAGVGDAIPYRLGLAALGPLLPRLLDPGRRVDLAELRDREAGAVALWLQGERMYRHARFDAALALYQRALAEDSALVVAAVKGAQAANWSNRAAEAGALARLALSRESALPRRYRALARGIAAYSDGQADTALAWLGRGLREYPDWAEALMASGEVAFHLFPAVSAPDSAAESWFRASLRADDGFAPPAIHLAEIALRQGDWRGAGRLVTRLRRARADSVLVRTLELMQECVRGRLGEVAWLESGLYTPASVLAAARTLSPGARQPRCAEEAYRAVLHSPERAWHWGAFLGLHGILAAEGRIPDLLALTDSVAAGTPIARATLLLDALAGLPVDSAAAAVAVFLRTSFGDSLQRLGPTESGARTRWLLGSWLAHRGDTAGAAALLASLQAVARAAPSPTVARYLAALDAHVRLAHGDSARAFTALRDLRPGAAREVLSWDLGASLAVERLQAGELALARGDAREALRLASAFDHVEPVPYLVFVPASLDLRLRAARVLGRPDLVGVYGGRLRALGRPADSR